jgi:hypothetical protein
VQRAEAREARIARANRTASRRANEACAGTAKNVFAIGTGVVLCPLVIPWGYVFTNYLRKAGDRWK